MMKSRKILFLFLLSVLFSVLITPMALADIGDSIHNAIGSVLNIGKLDFLFGGSSPDNQLIGFIRIALAILVFTIIYMGLSAINTVASNAIPKNIAITIGIILAIITAVFTPGSVLLMFGETYAVIFALLLIGGPIAGILALCLMTPTPNRGVALIKFLAVCFTIWLIAQIGAWAEMLSSATGVI